MRILITGACGSVGSALVKRFLVDGHTVCAFDQSEDGLFRLDQEFKNHDKGEFRPFLGSVRDANRLRVAMENVDLVFHCAALKHVYLSEYNPFEATQTNIEGTHNVIESAIAANVKNVVMTSSDKAVNPTSTMGATKLLGERLIVAANHISGSHKTRFSCVRFGNVINSNGSVLQIFKKQMENGFPITITDPNMTRFFISMGQAVDLCIFAATEMIGGEIFVMDMGSTDIMTFAKAVSFGNPFNYEVIGFKPGEKLYEELVTEGEALRTVVMGNIYVVCPDTLDMMAVDIQSQYKKYENYAKLGEPLRSDRVPLDENKLRAILDNVLTN